MKYIKSFADNKIDGAILCTLDDSELKELGVNNKFHRRRIISDVQREREMKSQSVTAASASGAAVAGSGGGGMDSKHNAGSLLH